MSHSRPETTDAEFAARLQLEEDAQFRIYRDRQIAADHRLAQSFFPASASSSVPAPIAALPTEAIPADTFTANDIEKIKKHFDLLTERKEGQHLQELMKAVLEDDAIEFDFFCNPVFIRGDGQILDKETAIDLQKKNFPSPRAGTVFTEKDIIPCNTIILAMKELLNLINGNNSNSVDLNIDPHVKIQYKKIAPQYISYIEKYYNGLPPQHQRFFNIVCRGSSGHILDEPVLLPDGYLYEKSLAHAWLATAKAGATPCYCPQSRILFTAEDITPCHFSIAVLELIAGKIKLGIATQQALSSASAPPASPRFFANQASSSASSSSSHSIAAPDNDERHLLIQEVRDLISSLQPNANKIKFSRPELINESMHQVLLAAMESLETLNIDCITKTKKQLKDCTDVMTTAGAIFNKKSSMHRNNYAKFASALGTVTTQPGYYVYKMLEKVEAAIPRFQSKHALSPHK